MPDFNDLKEIKDKIDSIGDEKNILEEKGVLKEDVKLPEEKVEESPLAIDESDHAEEEIIEKEETGEEDLLGDILEDFEKGHVIQEENGEIGESSTIEEEETE